MNERRRAYLKAYSKAYYESHKEAAKERAKEWDVKHPKRRIEISRAWNERNRDARSAYNKAHPHQQKHRNLKFGYGISLDEYQRLLDAQSGLCLGCKRHSASFNMALAVDEMPGTKDSKAPFIRGLLCGQCNTALGLARDNPETLRRLAQYAEESRKRYEYISRAV